MPSERLRRLQSKSHHGQFQWVLENEFELSPREAGAVVETARNIYDLDRLKSVKEKDHGQVERIVVSQQTQHGSPMEAPENVKVTVTLDSGEDDQQVGRIQGSTAMRQKRIMLRRHTRSAWVCAQTPDGSFVPGTLTKGLFPPAVRVATEVNQSFSGQDLCQRHPLYGKSKKLRVSPAMTNIS